MPEAHLDVEALYAALDAQRKSKKLSWRQLAAQVDTSPSTLTRMARGKRPDVDSFAALVEWLGVSADQFLRPAQPSPTKKKAEPMAMISTYLRASKDLSLGRGLKLDIDFDVFNVLNTNAPTAATFASGLTFGYVTGVIPARIARIAARFRF